MSDEDATPFQRRRIPGWAVAAAFCILAAAAGFAVGRATAPSAADAGASDTCAEAQEVYDYGMRKANEIGATEPGAEPDLRLAINAVLQNPECFNAGTRAGVQTFADMLDGRNR